MKKTDHQAILAALEQALAVCENTVGFQDEAHRKICEDLRATHTQLLSVVNASAARKTN